LYVLDGDRQRLACLDPKDGAVIWDESLGVREIFRSSPTGADGRIYCISENGTVVIASAGRTFRHLNTIALGESPVRASVVAAHGRLYIRTAQHLYCIGSP
jgi:outer membrane protein assembly factor BamB